MVHYRAEVGNTCGTFHLVHLGRYALGGFGLVFVEATAVQEIGLINEHDLGLWSDAQVESFKPLIAFMRRQTTAIGIQLAHGGRKSSSQTAMQGMGPLTEENLKAGAKIWQPVGPTAEPVAKGWLTPRQLTTAECKAMVATWADAARNAVKAGFDVIEIHAAHGYRRLTVAFARELKVRGVDVIDCSSGGISGAATAAQVTRSLGFQVPFAEPVRKEALIATQAVGMILEAPQAEAILHKGQADLIAVGRQAQYNPNIAHHWAHELGINRRFEDWTAEYGWWLEKRIKTREGFATPTGAVLHRS
jgi:2,4-dienoyl-CoA reductase-like NADH-dependent reductase (Old Yellow Enzyme family)